MQVKDRLKTVNYDGIFLSCYSDFSEKCFHAAPEHVLVYVYSGEQIIEDRNKKIRVKAGECVFIRRNHQLIMHKNSVGNAHYKGISLTFKRSVLKEFYSKLNKSKLPREITVSDTNVFPVEKRVDVTSLFESLTPYFEENTTPSKEVIQLKLLEGIYALLNNSAVFYPLLFDFTEPWKIDILEFLNDHYMDDLTLEEIAFYSGRSLATFKRDFKKVSNLTPQRWMIKKRLEVAYSRLKESKEKIQTIYLEVGFKNPSHFSTAFKKQYGVSPTAIE